MKEKSTLGCIGFLMAYLFAFAVLMTLGSILYGSTHLVHIRNAWAWYLAWTFVSSVISTLFMYVVFLIEDKISDRKATNKCNEELDEDIDDERSTAFNGAEVVF